MLFSSYLLDSLEHSEGLIRSFAVPESERGPYWQTNIEVKGQELRDQYDVVSAPTTSISNAPNEIYAELYSRYVSVLKIHADAFDALKATGDVSAYRESLGPFFDQLGTLADDAADAFGY